MAKPLTLRDVAKVVRSKNAGPFELTFDVMFETRELFDLVKTSGVLTPETLAALYNVAPDSIVTFQFIEPALAFKMTLRRPRPQGSIGETDTFGAQQHAPLLGIELPDWLGHNYGAAIQAPGSTDDNAAS